TLIELLNLGSAAYRRLVRRSALRRISRESLQRNAAVALGNSNDPRAVAPLARALRSHPSALVRAHAAWALGQLRRWLDRDARDALKEASSHDDDPYTRESAQRARLGLVTESEPSAL
ncbi:MAG TPA: HEAT repeat domain-containing protein, partial [Polyangiaceae bacterium]|nr:HEAT repeat domain-containing protein [Polyangiaceae bacterium]